MFNIIRCEEYCQNGGMQLPASGRHGCTRKANGEHEAHEGSLVVLRRLCFLKALYIFGHDEEDVSLFFAYVGEEAADALLMSVLRDRGSDSVIQRQGVQRAASAYWASSGNRTVVHRATLMLGLDGFYEASKVRLASANLGQKRRIPPRALFPLNTTN